MGRAIAVQPDGLLAVFSTVTDRFVMVDATEEDVVAEAVARASDRAERETRVQVKHARDGFPPDYEELLEDHLRTTAEEARG